jgi:23S rRNA pseudouridine2457 synthase
LKYYVFYKPFNVLNQFSKERPEHVTLADFLPISKDIYPVGRLDKDSEGLLIMTNDTSLNAALLSPSKKHKRSYFVQLDNDITDKAIQQVAYGVQIKLDSGIYTTNSCIVKKLQKPPVLPERNPPVRFRQNIPTSWALIELTEGKNRQVRKMFAAVGFPVLRLVRVQIEDLKIGKLEPGKYFEIKQEELFKLLKIDPKELQAKKREKLRTAFGKKEEKKPKEIIKPEVKPATKSITKKNAPPKSGYSNAPKKSTTDRLAAKAKSEDKPTDTKKSLSRKPKGSAPWQKPKRTSGKNRG